jgi:nucleoside-diphosphate-sugar epimerase
LVHQREAGPHLVTGAGGQIGAELVPALRERYGQDRVIATDVKDVGGRLGQPFDVLDATDDAAVERVFAGRRIGTVYHLAALLSVTAERKPQAAYAVNLGSLVAVLEAARRSGAAAFVPSSIAAFGPGTPRDDAPQDTLQRPTTMYGVTKVAGELLCDYYHRKFGVDTRGLRFPGLISHVAEPGGGTTDYAVDMFHFALRGEPYACYLRPDTRIDMMYMPDAVRATIELMEADAESLRHRNAFNISAFAVTPAELAEEIGRVVPGFEVRYEVDPARQAIADSWPRSVDDSAAREEWGWQPEYDLPAMVEDMIAQLSARAQPVGGR